jgi:Fic family protein
MMETADLDDVVDWPKHGHETRPWRSTVRGPREDRMLSEVVVSIPPMIADLTYAPPAQVQALLERATVDIATLDARHGDWLASFGTFLVRTEAVSSSRIERHNASLDDLAKATLGMKATEDARLTVAAADAVHRMVQVAGETGRIGLDDILAAHHRLLRDDPRDGKDAGKLRIVQNWIGGSDYSPRGAVHVPPPPEKVAGYLDDLVAFANRDDLSALVQAGIAHAQFESVHPFTDGNGRVGRALINAILRRRRITSRLVVPIASAMVADVDLYFRRVNAYRAGHVGQFVAYLADSAQRAATAAGESALALAALPTAWAAELKPRAGSTIASILAMLMETPAIDAGLVARNVGVSSTAAYAALARLTEAGVLHELTKSKRDRAWAATEVLAEVDALNARLRQVSSS